MASSDGGDDEASACTCYAIDNQDQGAHAHGMMVLTLRGDRVACATRFHDNRLLARFGLPETPPATSVS